MQARKEATNTTVTEAPATEVAVIADIVGSRTLDDRAAAQRAIDAVIERVERDAPLATRPLLPVAVSYTHLTLPTNREV